MTEDRIKPLLFDELTDEEIAYWRAKEPWNFPTPPEEKTPPKAQKPEKK